MNPNPAALALLAWAPRDKLKEYLTCELDYHTTPVAIEEILTLNAMFSDDEWPDEDKRDIRSRIVSGNPHIFEAAYDYAAIRGNMDLVREEPCKAALHPRRLARWMEMGGDLDEF